MATKQIPTNTKNTRNPYKKDVYDAYVTWRSIPPVLRSLAIQEVSKKRV